MAHFYGTVDGAGKTRATRRGHKTTGLKAVAASYSGAIEVTLEHDPKTGRDRYVVRQIPWKGSGKPRTLAEGALGD